MSIQQSTKYGVKERLWNELRYATPDGWRVDCAIFDIPMSRAEATMDRYPIPGCRGGTYAYENVRLACAPCNERARNLLGRREGVPHWKDQSCVHVHEWKVASPDRCGSMRHRSEDQGAWAQGTLEQVASLGRASGVCLVCGRALSDPLAIERGIGARGVAKV